MRLTAAFVVAAAALCGTAAQAEDITVKLGVLNDMSGLYSDISGPGSVVAAKMAVEDFKAAEKGIKAESARCPNCGCRCGRPIRGGLWV